MSRHRKPLGKLALATTLALVFLAASATRADAQFYGGMGYGGMGYGGMGYGGLGYGGMGYGGMGYGYGGGYGGYGGGFGYGLGYGGFGNGGYGYGFPGSVYYNPDFGVGLTPLGVQSYLMETNMLGRSSPGMIIRHVTSSYYAPGTPSSKSSKAATPER